MVGQKGDLRFQYAAHHAEESGSVGCVYEARNLDTKDQAKVVKWAKTVIPAQHFKDIPAKVPLPK
jgi:hypothetical protein